MKKMKRFTCAAMAAAMVMSLAACSGGGDSGSGSATTAAAGGDAKQETEAKKDGEAKQEAALSGDKTVVEVWTGDRHDMEYVQSMVDKYNAENTDNIEIKLTIITEDYANMLALGGGIVGENLTADLAFQVGQAVGTVLMEEKGERPTVVLGKDTRISSDLLDRKSVV